MAKRFTDNGIWKKGWFMKLPAHLKLFWQYLRDDCDAAGVWEPNFDIASVFVGESISEKDLEVFGDRVEKLTNGKFWLTTFIEFQYNNNLSEKSPAHKPIISSLKKNRLYDRVFNRVSDTLQEKDKEKDKDKEKEQEKQKVEKETETQSFEPAGIAPDMVKAFVLVHPNYPKDQTRDFAACLEIAYKIADANGWPRQDVLNTKKLETLKFWEQIVHFSAQDKWFSKRSISDLSNEWQRLIQSYTNGTTHRRGVKENSSSFIP
jgi:hypothetical protein